MKLTDENDPYGWERASQRRDSRDREFIEGMEMLRGKYNGKPRHTNRLHRSPHIHYEPAEADEQGERNN